MRIGVDVDLTLVDTGKEWWKWLADCGTYGAGYSLNSFVEENKQDKLNYDLSQHFPNYEEVTGCDPFNFWNQEYLYDYLLPLPHSVEVLQKLIDNGHQIVFISHCKGGHFSSKVKWLKKYFPFADIGGKGGFIATKEKHLVNVDVIIDDRVENLLRFGEEVIKIYVDTIYEDVDFNKESVDFVSSIEHTWSSIEDWLEENDFI